MTHLIPNKTSGESLFHGHLKPRMQYQKEPQETYVDYGRWTLEYTTKACTCCKHCIYYTQGHGAQITKSWQHKDKRPKVESRLSWWQWSATVVWFSLSQVGLIKSWKIHDILKVNCNQAGHGKEYMSRCLLTQHKNQPKPWVRDGNDHPALSQLFPPETMVNPRPRIWFTPPPKWRNPPD